MRITTRLRIVSTVTIAALAVLAPVLLWSFLEFKSAKNDYVLADAIQDNFFERASFRDQYFLYREDRARVLWDKKKETADDLLRQAEVQFHRKEDQHALEHLRKNMEDSAAIFHRIVNNTEALNTAIGNRHVYDELDKRLYSQLLLKAASVRDTATVLQNAASQRIELTYQRLTLIIGLFAVTLALATILIAMQLARLIRKRLVPLHDGAKIVADGNLDYRIKGGGADEFAELALSINAMTDKLASEINMHKQLEVALRDSDERLHMALSGTGMATWDWHIPSGALIFDARWAELQGYTLEELPPRIESWETRVFPDDMPQVKEKLDRHFKGETPAYESEHRVLHKDGHWVWVLGRGKVVEWDGAGNPVRAVGTAIDISERKRHESIQMARLRLMESATSLALKELLVATLDEACALTGSCIGFYHFLEADQKTLSLQAWSTRTTSEFCKAEGEGAHYDIAEAGVWVDCVRERRPVIHNDYAALPHKRGLPPGHAHVEREMVVPIFRKGLIVAILGVGNKDTPYGDNDLESITRLADIAWDIVETKRAEKELRASEQRFMQLFMLVPIPLGVVNKDGAIVYFNDWFTKVFGYTTDDVPTLKEWWQLAYPDESYRQWVMDSWGAAVAKAAKEGTDIEPAEYRVACKNGAERIVMIGGTIIEDNLLATFVDITERKQAEQALRESKNRLDEAQRIGKLGFLDWDLITNEIELSDDTLRMYGLDIARKKLSIEEIVKLIHPDDAELATESLNGAIKGSGKHDIEHRIVRPDGKVIYAHTNAEVFRDANGKPIRVLGTAQDITERKQAELALRESEERLRATIETSMDAVVQMDAEGVITGWNSQTEEIFGWSRVEAVGRALHETIIPPQHREAHVRGLRHFLLTGEGPILNKRIEIVGMHRDGRVFPVELTVTPIKMGGKYEFSAFLRDITKKKESEEIIWKQANFDLLTGLPNRHMFHDRMEQEIKKAKRARFPVALMFIDLDHFKEINDTLGHDMGDLLLVEAARRISDCVRATDIVARLGGDEFTVLLAEIDDVGSVERVAQSIIQKLASPFRLKDEVSYVSASIGITLYPNDADTIEALFKNADQAMYVAKNQGRNRHSYFTHAMQEAAQTKLRLVNDLRNALAAGQLMVYFQPIVDLATGRINKAEALIRWKHPERGMVSPAEFIPQAEETGLIFEIGDWVFHESMRWAKRWRELYNPLLQISVNKSPVQFYKDGDEHSAWLSYLQKLGLPGQSLAIEITEGLLLDSNISITGALHTLRNSDIQVSIDDFGTGYSSLSYLKKFDIDYLKIDRSFVRDLETDPNDLALSEAIIVMAHKLGIKVVAEGVETEQQRDLLAAAGCDYAQGYLYSRPIPAEEFEGLLKQGYL